MRLWVKGPRKQVTQAYHRLVISRVEITSLMMKTNISSTASSDGVEEQQLSLVMFLHKNDHHSSDGDV
jgi:hypothetical protein